MSEIELYKPNELIGAIDQLEVSRTAKHLLNFFLQYAQQQIKFNNHTDNKFEVDVNHINGLADIHRTDYEKLKQALKKLMQPITLCDDPNCYDVLVPITRITIDVPNAVYKFELQSTVTDLLRNTEYFTKLKLQEFNPLQSKHSLVIYEWLKRYETSPQIPLLTVEDLRNITHTADKKTYDNFTHLQLKVLDVAVREINEKTPYTVNYEPIKTRTKRRPKVTAVKFTMTKKKSAEQLAGTSGIESKEIDSVRRQYEALCVLYINYNFCNTKEDFYRATYEADYKLLKWFFDKKKDLKQKNKLQWLLADIKNSESGKRPRRANQTDYYKSLFDKEDRQTQGQLERCQSKQGFLEIVLKLQKRHNDNKQIDIEKWL